METNKQFAVGIDLGTTKSCIALFSEEQIKIIPNEYTNLTTPSFVAFNADERLIGDPAKMQASQNPSNTIFNIKRIIGKQYNDKTLENDQKFNPFKLINEQSQLKIIVSYRNEAEIFTPEDVLAIIIEQLKLDAQLFFSNSITDAVITIPAHFTLAQRYATQMACNKAGINVLRLISKSAAASIDYCLKKQNSGQFYWLVFCLGGGSSEVSVICAEEGILEVKSVTGNPNLGGINFDNRMMEYFIEKFKQKYNKDITKNKKSIQRLREACENAKCILSSSFEASIGLNCFYDDVNFNLSISRDRFQQINNDLFQSLLQLVEKALYDAKKDKSDIDEILLIGHSTQIPKIQQLLQEFFNGKQLNKSIISDQPILCGAAIQAAILTGNKSDSIKNFLLLDIILFSLGIETGDGVMTTLIKRNTTIPAKHTMTFTTSSDNQNSIQIRIYQGENSMVKDNQFLGLFELKDIPSAKQDLPKIDITIDVDVFLNIHISATEKSTGKTNQIKIDEKPMAINQLSFQINNTNRLIPVKPNPNEATPFQFSPDRNNL